MHDASCLCIVLVFWQSHYTKSLFWPTNPTDKLMNRITTRPRSSTLTYVHHRTICCIIFLKTRFSASQNKNFEPSVKCCRENFIVCQISRAMLSVSRPHGFWWNNRQPKFYTRIRSVPYTRFLLRACAICSWWSWCSWRGALNCLHTVGLSNQLGSNQGCACRDFAMIHDPSWDILQIIFSEQEWDF